MTSDIPKILVVDDEQHQLDTVCRGLFLYGYECTGALNVKTALEILEGPDGNSFDLILTDLTMPGCSGLDLIDKAGGIRPALPVIVITGLAATPEVEQVLKRGTPILQKPFEPDTLDKTIRALLPTPAAK